MKRIDSALWVQASTIRRGRYWLEVGVPQESQTEPPSEALELLQGLHPQEPSVAWRIRQGTQSVAASGFLSSQRLVLGKPFWSLVYLATDDSARAAAAELLASIGREPDGLASLVTQAIHDVMSDAFAVTDDLLTQFKRMSVRKDVDSTPSDKTSTADAAMSEEPLIEQNDYTRRQAQVNELNGSKMPRYTTIAATFTTAPGPLVENGAWILTPDGVNTDDEFDLQSTVSGDRIRPDRVDELLSCAERGARLIGSSARFLESNISGLRKRRTRGTDSSNK